MKQSLEAQYAKAKEKIQCETCGATITRNGLYHHKKTNKHLGIIKPRRTKEMKYAYQRQWVKDNPQRNKATNHQYYMKNKHRWLIYNDKDICLVKPQIQQPIMLYFD